MAKVWIEEDTLTGIADAIRSKKGMDDLIPTTNMRNEILSISSVGVGIEGGYVAHFYDEDRNLIQIISSKDAMINAPSYKNSKWIDDSGESFVDFPLLLTQNESYYAMIFTTYADLLYDNFGVNRDEYPYILVTAQDGESWTHFFAYFLTEMPNVTNSSFNVGAGFRARYQPATHQETDMATSVDLLIQNASRTLENISGYSGNKSGYMIYGNFDNEYLDGNLNDSVENSLLMSRKVE